VNVIDEGKLQGALDEVIDRAMKQLQASADRLVLQLSNVIAGTLQGMQGVEDKAAADLDRLVERLDGITVEVDPIVIPKIVVRVKVPGVVK
jgi:hypothetical protein